MVHVQPQLLAPLAVAVVVQLHDRGPSGWDVHVVARLDGEDWGAHQPQFFSELTVSEAWQVVADALGLELGIVDT